MNPFEKHVVRESPEDYHANEALSASGLRHFRKSPLHYRHSLLTKPEPTLAMRVGNLVHCLVLERHLFCQRYAITPTIMDRRTKAGREAYAEWLQDVAGKVIVTEAEYETAEACAEAVKGIFPPSGLTEATYRASTEYGTLQCRFDRLVLGAMRCGSSTKRWSPSWTGCLLRQERLPWSHGSSPMGLTVCCASRVVR